MFIEIPGPNLRPIPPLWAVFRPESPESVQNKGFRCSQQIAICRTMKGFQTSLYCSRRTSMYMLINFGRNSKNPKSHPEYRSPKLEVWTSVWARPHHPTAPSDRTIRPHHPRGNLDFDKSTVLCVVQRYFSATIMMPRPR